MKNNGSDLPIFETDEDRSYFLTILPIHPFFLQNERNVTNKSSEKVSTRKTREELHNMVLSVLKERGDMSANELASVLGYKKLTDTLRGVLNEMITLGEAAYLYPNKQTSRNQKIKLVKKRLWRVSRQKQQL